MTQESPRIVVGVDGSDESKCALRWAAYLATVAGASIDVVIAWDYPPSYGTAAAPDWSPRQDAEQILAEALNDVFGSHRPKQLQTVVCEGNATRMLLDIGAGATMLIVGSRGRGGFVGLLLGSVSAAVAEQSTCPVVVVHGERLPPEPGS